jgi:cysteine desulfurase / selenocysteine lyase
VSLILDKVRQDTPACLRRLHLNNAGASLVPLPVQQVVTDYLNLENSIGGYEAELARADQLEQVYSSLAQLIGGRPQEIAITQNATRSWDMVFYGLPLSPGDKILTCRSEYASNYIAFLQRCRQTGAKIVVLDNDSNGVVCCDSLRKALDERVKLVAINHLPTNSGLVQPAEEIGRIVKEHPAFYLLDACQSVGQIPLDVDALCCDALSATSRKYLRGPRGVGFLYMRQEHIAGFEPPFLDLHAATWTAPEMYEVRSDARRFETYEIFVAGKLGLGAAAEYAMNIGVENGWKRIRKLAEETRAELSKLDGVTVCDPGQVKSGIVTFVKDGLAPKEIRRRLFELGTNIWTSTVRSARLDMESRSLDEVARASLHYFNTSEEIDGFVAQVASL